MHHTSRHVLYILTSIHILFHNMIFPFRENLEIQLKKIALQNFQTCLFPISILSNSWHEMKKKIKNKRGAKSDHMIELIVFFIIFEFMTFQTLKTGMLHIFTL